MNVDQKPVGQRGQTTRNKNTWRKVKVLCRHEPFTYLGKLLTVAGADEKQVLAVLKEYSEILENIAACLLPLAKGDKPPEIKIHGEKSRYYADTSHSHIWESC